MNMDSRLRALCDLMVNEVREYAGLHDYDGVVQDLSPAGVQAGLRRLGGGAAAGDGRQHDAAHLAIFEDRLRVEFGEAEMHRRNPAYHLMELDLSCYDREYAPEEERAAARRRHVAAWPQAIDAAVASLDQVSAPTARALLPAVEGLAAGLPGKDGDPGDDPGVVAARAAHARLVEHVRRAQEAGDPDPALGTPLLARLLGVAEGVDADLGRLEEAADAERDRLRERLADACARLVRGATSLGVRPAGPDQDTAAIVRGVLDDHPDAGGVLDEARALAEESIAFTRERGLLDAIDGACEVEVAPPSRRHVFAMMSWAAPYEPDAPSRYYITPPEPTWSPEEQTDWLQAFNRATLAAITVHEVAPGHFAHGRALRHAPTDVRRTLMSLAFVEGWAHYTEELCVEEGFRDGDPRFEIGVWLEALCRVTRFAVALGVHRRTMTLEEGVARFTEDAFLQGVAAEHEAWRATYDPTYGRYTWGKLEIMRLRDGAKARWGSDYSHRRFHSALLALGAPPLGLMGAALEDGVP
jgi:hypothetical protein